MSSDRCSCFAGICACLSALATVIVAVRLLVVLLTERVAPAERLGRGDAVAAVVVGAVFCGLCMLSSAVLAARNAHVRRHESVRLKERSERALPLEPPRRAGTTTRLLRDTERGAFSEDERAAAIQIQSAWRRWAGATFYRHWRKYYAGQPPSPDALIVWRASQAARRDLRL